MSTYIALNRPPSDVTIPEGWATRTDYWMGAVTHTHMGDFHNFGEIQYEHALPFDVVEKLEWMPVNMIEWAHYQFYRYSDSTVEGQRDFEEDYLNAMRLGILRESDRMYAPTEILFKYERNNNPLGQKPD